VDHVTAQVGVQDVLQRDLVPALERKGDVLFHTACDLFVLRGRGVAALEIHFGNSPPTGFTKEWAWIEGSAG
jgi:hypothetical protein